MTDLAALHAFRADELARPRHQDARRLTGHGAKAFSQADEDGIIAEIFRRIGTTDRSFVEIGVETGIECNTLWLLMQGWHGAWIEGNPKACRAIAASHRHWLADGALKLHAGFVTAENIDALIAGLGFDREIDLLSIDIDYNDYWVWKALGRCRPRVVVMEYNAMWLPPAAVTVPYDPKASWKQDSHYGASLGRHKGYALVGCSLSGVNAFFVRDDLVADRFLAPGDAVEHYEPARYFLAGMPSGHKPAVGPLVTVDA